MGFIVCPARKSRPRVSTETCLKCRRAAACGEYRRYREPFLFREMNTQPAGRKRRVRGEAKTRGETKKTVQEQAKLL